MSLRATLMFLVAIDAFGQAPQTAPPTPTKSAPAQTPKGKEPGDSVCRKRFWCGCRQSRAAIPAHSRRRGGAA